MKKTSLLTVAFLALCLCSFAETNVERWGQFESSFTAAVKGNPFDVRFGAVFSNGNVTVSVPGFYDGEDTFRVRFMPPAEGHWTYVTTSSVGALKGKKGSFDCIPASEGNHGPVHAEGVGFRYADGTVYHPVGTTSYDWMHVQGDYPERTVSSLAESGFNKIRMLFFLHNLPIEYPEVYPFEKKTDGNWDYDHFNPAYFQYVEQRIAALREIGVEADLILFHPYDGGRWGFDRMPLDVNLRYLSYLSARVSSYRNLWWSLANEFDGVKGIPAEDWDKFADRLIKEDPYGHLLSIHGYTATYYDYFQSRYTHTSIQDQAPVEDFGRAATVKNIYKKPVVFDEVCYEGNVSSRWGCLSGEEMLMRMYLGSLAGCYVTHAETFNLDENGGEGEQMTNYLAYGGEFHGESWKRVKLLREILESSPGQLTQADKSWDVHTFSGGEGHYLVYFGKEMPGSWKFDLPTKNCAAEGKIGEGERYKVEIIDTWEMTITEVPGDFITAKPGQYRIQDKDGRSIKLPMRPYLLLRITRQ